MKTEFEKVLLDETNVEFTYASEFVTDTDKLVYVTGKAGTGKTTFLKYIKETTTKSVVVLAPTGVAAINAGGQTIHSFFQLPFGPFVINDKRLRTRKDSLDNDETTIYNTFRYREDKLNIIEKLELLIIDEISMVRCDTLDVIDRLLRVFRKKNNLPFGGVQVILIGDTFQLPPIADIEQWRILKDFYQSPYFFSSKVVQENKPVYLELKKIYRQKEHEFINLLDKIRVNQITDPELIELNKKYDPSFSTVSSNNHIILATTNAQVHQTNATKLDELTGELKVYPGEITGTFPKDTKGNFVLPTEQYLHLKVGAQVMTLRNDTGEIKRYFNGKIGTISSLDNDKIIIEFPKQTKIILEKATWNNIRYTWNKEKKKIEEEIIGTFIQYPLRLAWAITVHKSQGLTFENVYADLASAFEDGQVYVALSRCTSYNGLVLKSPIHRSRIRTNPRVIEFAQTETPNTLIVQELCSGKADFYYKKVRENIKSLSFTEAYDNFVNAIKYRNDIETALLKRYFIVSASRLGTFKQKLKSTLSDVDTKTKENKYLHDLIAEFEIEKSFLQTRIENQNDALNVLNETNKSLEMQIEYLTSEISFLKTAGEEAIKTIQQHHEENQQKATIISGLESTIMYNNAELERLRNIKWYQKLFGHK